MNISAFKDLQTLNAEIFKQKGKCLSLTVNIFKKLEFLIMNDFEDYFLQINLDFH